MKEFDPIKFKKEMDKIRRKKEELENKYESNTFVSLFCVIILLEIKCKHEFRKRNNRKI